MEVRSTTKEAYEAIKENGLLSNTRFIVYEILCKYGPLTANEMRMYASKDVNSGVFSTRLSELERMGVVNIIGKRICKTSGYNALVWDVNNNMPTKLLKELTKNEKKKNVLNLVKELGLIIDIKWKDSLRKIYKEIENL